MDSKKKISQKRELKVLPIVGVGKLLVMEEKEPFRKMLSIMLELLGYESEFARDGDEAIELYKHAMVSGQPHKVVILDLTVNTGNGGEETIKKLLQIDPDVKAVYSSGNLYDAVMTDYRKYGFTAVLPKSYMKKDLSDTLPKVLMEKSSDC